MKFYQIICCIIVTNFDFDNSATASGSNGRSGGQESVEATKAKLSNEVKFYLYTRKNPDTPDQLLIGDYDGLGKSHFSHIPTKMIVHGWKDSYLGPNSVSIREALLKRDNYNVIVVDWSNIADKDYAWVTKRITIIGEYVASMVDFLESHGCNHDKMSLSGHSLGAHIVGIAGHSTKNKVGHIVGLDPAIEEFESAGPGSRIAKGDAKLVEIIHTNAGKLGYTTPIGDNDFYPNGGQTMPGCKNDTNGECSHGRAYEYYAESINSVNGFHGRLCENYEAFSKNMCKENAIEPLPGVEAISKKPGSYYFQTGVSAPYALGAEGAKP